jgi:uncharacterized membrane protein
MRRELLAAFIAAAMLTTASAARAAETGFTLCNRTHLTVVYAKALNVAVTGVAGADTGTAPLIESEGWRTLAPGACQVLWAGSLKYRYYLIYAEGRDSNRVWSGDKSICVEDGTFSLKEPVCPATRNRRMFIQVDTGDSYSFTYDLN